MSLRSGVDTYFIKKPGMCNLSIEMLLSCTMRTMKRNGSKDNFALKYEQFAKMQPVKDRNLVL